MLLLLALACQPRPAPSVETPPPPPSAPPPPAPPPPLPGEPKPTSAWSSPSCGERTYERRLWLNPSFTYNTEERVSPCPPDVTCIWSGVVYTQGTWAEAEGLITFTETQGDPKAAPRPAALRWTEDRSGLLEMQGDTGCLYTPLLAVESPQQRP